MPDKSPEEIADDIMIEADEDMDAEDLTRGTEVYEEIDDEVDAGEDDPEELDFEPEEEEHSSILDEDDGPVAQDAYEGDDEY